MTSVVPQAVDTFPNLRPEDFFFLPRTNVVGCHQDRFNVGGSLILNPNSSFIFYSLVVNITILLFPQWIIILKQNTDIVLCYGFVLSSD